MYASSSHATVCSLCSKHPPAASMARRFLAGPGASWRFRSCEAACTFLRVEEGYREKQGSSHPLKGYQAEFLALPTEALPCVIHQMVLSLECVAAIKLRRGNELPSNEYPGKASEI